MNILNKFQRYYRKTSREIKRITSVTLSPIYAHFSETISGLVTIRALRESSRYSVGERYTEFEQCTTASNTVCASSIVVVLDSICEECMLYRHRTVWLLLENRKM